MLCPFCCVAQAFTRVYGPPRFESGGAPKLARTNCLGRCVNVYGVNFTQGVVQERKLKRMHQNACWPLRWSSLFESKLCSRWQGWHLYDIIAAVPTWALRVDALVGGPLTGACFRRAKLHLLRKSEHFQRHLLALGAMAWPCT